MALCHTGTLQCLPGTTYHRDWGTRGHCPSRRSGKCRTRPAFHRGGNQAALHLGRPAHLSRRQRRGARQGVGPATHQAACRQHRHTRQPLPLLPANGRLQQPPELPLQEPCLPSWGAPRAVARLVRACCPLRCCGRQRPRVSDTASWNGRRTWMGGRTPFHCSRPATQANARAQIQHIPPPLPFPCARGLSHTCSVSSACFDRDPALRHPAAPLIHHAGSTSARCFLQGNCRRQPRDAGSQRGPCCRRPSCDGAGLPVPRGANFRWPRTPCPRHGRDRRRG